MAKKSDKRTMVILLIILGIVLVGSGLWLFNILKPIETTVNVQGDIKVRKLFMMKETALDNIEDFLNVDFAPESIWEEFYNSDQYMELQKVEININTEEGVGNPDPFTRPPEPEEEE